MRKGACGLVVVVMVGSLGVVPASAAFGAIVQLPAGSPYSPFGGPATVTFTFDALDAASIFTVRLRRPGYGVIKEKGYLVDPASAPSPHDVSFSWQALSVTTPTDYVVEVLRRYDGSRITSAPFTLLPRLVSDLSATPSPFYPLVQDGYKDRTRIGYSLAADSVDTVARVFRDDEFGRCCGPDIRTASLGPLPIGTRSWTWDGTRDDASTVSKGTYFVKITATDVDGASMTSKAQRVDVTRGVIRRTATKQRRGSSFDRAADEEQTALGGDCHVTRDAAAREADVLCVNANISLYWRWGLDAGERIESIEFEVRRGLYDCRLRKSHTTTQSWVRILAPPTSTCTVVSATITYSYPVAA